MQKRLEYQNLFFYDDMLKVYHIRQGVTFMRKNFQVGWKQKISAK